MQIINQPFQGQLGNLLTEELKKNYSSLTIFSAFAKNSGVLRLKDAMENFRAKGHSIRAYIGIDLDGTSYEALLNLYSLCNDLYVIHSENFFTTYHSKIYLLENDNTAWCAVGSNNFTGGGLWTNFESCIIQTFSLPGSRGELQNIYEISEKYSDSAYPCSSRISSREDIDELLEANYISKEVSQKMTSVSRRKEQEERLKKTPLFGSEKVSIPRLITVEKQSKPRSKKASSKPSAELFLDKTQTAPAFTNEQFWFEMRESTGDSRNILDLSKLGQIESGSVKGTPYEYPDPARMFGGIRFFDIDPEDTGITKNITINYLGKDYYPSTIKFAPNNGSWRIQLKGDSDDHTEKLSRYGHRGDFVRKILVFEKINSEYYVLSLLDEKELDNIKALSRVWARNGSGSSSKAYGML